MTMHSNIMRPKFERTIEHVIMHAPMSDEDITGMAVLFSLMTSCGVRWQDVIREYLEDRPSLLKQIEEENQEWPEEHRQLFDQFIKATGLRAE